MSYSITDLDPCRNINCTYESFCHASTPRNYTCICRDNCPSYEEQVCASNGRTFKNMCFLKKEICETFGNYTKYHPGSCRGIKTIIACPFNSSKTTSRFLLVIRCSFFFVVLFVVFCFLLMFLYLNFICMTHGTNCETTCAVET